MTNATDVTQWEYLTGVINEIKSPGTFLRNLLFRTNIETLTTEKVELSTISGDREIAPFVRKNGEAIPIKGYGATYATVEAPNIRLKMPMTPSPLFFDRKPSTMIFPSSGEQISAIEAHVARDSQKLADMISNAEEWFAAMAIRGTVSYEVEDGEVFTITFPKPSGHTLTVSPLWSTTSYPEADFLTAQELISEYGLVPTDAIFGRNASAAFIKNARVASLLDNRRVDFGFLELQNPFREDGAIYMGTFSGIRCWRYGRALTLNGESVRMIRDDYVEFVCATPGAQNVAYYGAIPDWDAFEDGMFQGQRYSKSWVEKDPSVRVMLAHSRPLFVPRRPGSMVSMKVC
jgi:hypothetical protein